MHVHSLLFGWLFANIATVFGDDNRRGTNLPTFEIPSLFDQLSLPLSQLSGEVVAGLGRVMKIVTQNAPETDKLQTIFDIYQDSPVSLGASITFNADNYCKLGLAEENFYGPYEYDLDRLVGMNLRGGNRQFMIVIPGYKNRRTDERPIEIRKKWLELDGDAGGIAIEVHRDELASTPIYDRAVASTVLVARQVTILLHHLAELSGTHLMDPDFLARVHLIGHSLGAHIAGFVGKDLEGKLGRITALDPAGPVFVKLPNHQRLHRTDARLVEVMHTNSGRMNYMNLAAGAVFEAVGNVLMNVMKEGLEIRHTGMSGKVCFGIDAQLGHIDYYANDGSIQPGCNDALHICDHNRASQIYLDLLAYWCSIKRSQSHAALLDLVESQEGPEFARQLAQVNRLRAFKSPNFESFAVGHNFVQHCPQLMDIETHLDDAAVLQAFDQCSVPLFDMTKPLEEVIDELKTKHGIDFDNSSVTSGNRDGVNESDTDGQLEPWAAPRMRPSFYFTTTASEGDLVGDHFLLKIYLTKPISWNEAQCSLEVQIFMPDGDRITLKLKRLLHPTANQTVVAMPFVYHKSSEAKNRFNDLMHLVRLIDSPQNDGRPSYTDDFLAASEFSQFFPKKILLQPRASRSNASLFDLMMQKINGFSPLCQLTTDMIEVHPLLYGLKRNFGALYGRDLLRGGDTLQVISTSEQLRQRQNPSKRETKLTNEINSFTYGLEFAVVG